MRILRCDRLVAVSIALVALIASMLAPAVGQQSLDAQSARPIARIEARSAAVGLRFGAARRQQRSDEQMSSWSKGQCIGGLTYGAPLKLAVSYGGGLRYEPVNGGADVDLCTYGVAQVGLGGARVGIGQGASFGSIGSAVMVTGGLLRTFGAPSAATPKRTYGGISMHVLPLLAFGFEIGVYRRLDDGESADLVPGMSPARDEHKTIVVWAVGFGF